MNMDARNTSGMNGWSVGVDAIDKEHSTILSLIAEIQEIRQQRRDIRELSSILASVSAYTEYHFRTEEAVMDVVTFPGRDGHKTLHQTLKDRTNRLLYRTLADPRTVDVSEVHAFLKEWWEHHILREDMVYRPFVENDPRARETADRVSSKI